MSAGSPRTTPARRRSFGGGVTREAAGLPARTTRWRGPCGGEGQQRPAPVERRLDAHRRGRSRWRAWYLGRSLTASAAPSPTPTTTSSAPVTGWPPGCEQRRHRRAAVHQGRRPLPRHRRARPHRQPPTTATSCERRGGGAPASTRTLTAPPPATPRAPGRPHETRFSTRFRPAIGRRQLLHLPLWLRAEAESSFRPRARGGQRHREHGAPPR